MLDEHSQAQLREQLLFRIYRKGQIKEQYLQVQSYKWIVQIHFDGIHHHKCMCHSNQYHKHFLFLNIHCNTFKTISDFRSYRFYINTTYLLEISKLCDFHTIEPNFPTKTPSTKCWRFPVIFNKTDIMFFSLIPSFAKLCK